METFHHKNGVFLEPAVKGVKFKKSYLIDELLSLGNVKITRQIAVLVADEVEKEIHRRRIQFLSSELVSDMVAAKLEDLGLIKLKKISLKPESDKNKPDTLSSELLEVIVPSPISTKVKPPLASVPKQKKVSLSLSEKAVEVLREKFCLKDKKGEVVETPVELFSRVARVITSAESRYDPSANLEDIEAEFFNLMAKAEFFPDPSTLENAGKTLGMLSSSVVLPISEVLESVFEAMNKAYAIGKKGGEVSFYLNRLPASNPSSFMKIFHAAIDMVDKEKKSHHKSRSLLNVDHPDILNFISLLEEGETNVRFAMSVGVTDAFMDAVENDTTYSLKDPLTGDVVDEVRARKVFKNLVSVALNCGQPGIFFLDRTEADNPTPNEGALVAVNTEGDQPLLPFETLPFGSINLSSIVENEKINWHRLNTIIHTAVHFLDNLIEINHYPIQETGHLVRRNRKIALGLMGWGNLLEKMNLNYGSDEAIALAKEVMTFIQKEAKVASINLAKKRAPFSNNEESVFAKEPLKRRHAALTAISDSKILSSIADCSNSIEPTDSQGIQSSESLLHMQMAFQKHTEGGVFQDIPINEESAEADVAATFILAHRLGLKSVLFSKKGNVVVKQADPKPSLRPETDMEDRGNHYFAPPYFLIM